MVEINHFDTDSGPGKQLGKGALKQVSNILVDTRVSPRNFMTFSHLILG